MIALEQTTCKDCGRPLVQAKRPVPQHILYLNSLLLPFSMAVQWPHLTTVMAAGAALTTGLTIGAILALDNIAIARIISCVESGNAVEIVTKA